MTTTDQFSCPVCRHAVENRQHSFECSGCHHVFPVVLGFPDFRVSPPPHFDLKRDLAVASALVAAESTLDFDELVRLYYHLCPEAGDDLADKHKAHLAGEEDQARVAMQLLTRERPLGANDAVLEVGCGLGAHLAVAAQQAPRVAGVDLCLPFLVLTRKRLNGRGLLVAAEAERLPFPDASFAAVISADVIEHLADQQTSLQEMARVLLPGAALFLSTPNRYSLSPEPHVGLFGVGYLPRPWANWYVQRRRRIFYDDVRLLSAGALSRLLALPFPGSARLLIPGLSPRQLAHFPPLKRRLAEAYMTLSRVPVVRNAFYVFGPFFHAVAVKR